MVHPIILHTFNEHRPSTAKLQVESHQRVNKPTVPLVPSRTLAVLAARAPTVETVAGVRVSGREARGRGGEGRVGERLPAQGPGVASGRQRRQRVLLGASSAGTLV